MCCTADAFAAHHQLCKSLDVSETQQGLFADSHANDADVLAHLTRPDPSSFANFNIARATHYHLDLLADFEKTTFAGQVVVTVKAQVDDAQVVVFDIRDVNIKNVYLATGAKDTTTTATPATYWVSRKNGKLGQCVVVRLPENNKVGDEFFVRFEYETASDASAVQWLRPEQTVGKKHPYIFTQCQAIHARSLLVCQDTPGLKITWSASLAVPAPLQALMACTRLSDTPETITYNNQPYSVFQFEQNSPIAIYLIAILVGNVEKRELSHRSAVWSEPEVVDQAAWEFAEIEKMLVALEEICGPYLWPRYDIAVLPGSFPYGGMESELTFLTNSLLAGDRSLTNVLAHEISHSFSGNSTTNKDWECFYLNEGFTIYLERAIVGKLEGKDVKGLHNLIGFEDLKQSIAEFGEDNEFTKLNVDLSNDADPDDAFSSVPYEKGYSLLCALEAIVGETAMVAFLKAYFAKYKFASIDTNGFKTFFLDFMTQHGYANAELGSFDWDTWFYAPGMPLTRPAYSDVLAKEATTIGKTLIETGTYTNACDMSSWSSTQKIVFLDQLLDAQDVELTTNKDNSAIATKWLNIVNKITEFYDFANTKNAELHFRYLTLLVRSGVPGIEDKVGKFLTTYGRMKFTRPLYKDLFKSKPYRDFGVKLFAENRSFYHNICATMIGKDQAEALKKDYVW